MDHTEIARYFGVAPEIVRFLPELLSDLWELGSDPDLVTEWLAAEGLSGSGARVLDLGSGKGAVALTLAARLGCRVDGVDALPAFVEIARAEARARGLGERCTFTVGDLRETVRIRSDYDAVLLVSVGVLGSADEMVAGCRSCVVSGGLIVIDDAFLLRPTTVDFPGYRQLTDLEETRSRLTAHRDTLVRERITPLAEIRAQNRRYTSWIEQRASELAAQHPRHAAAFRAYVHKEQRECEILESQVGCATWMLRRA